ncbi:MAG: HigA family addiction module antitoxin [Acidobacteriota bacterium]
MRKIPFEPDWVSPPGDTLADLLEERGWTQAELARRLGVSNKHVNDLVHARASISSETALQLSRVLGSTPRFWLNLETAYRAEVKRLQVHKDANVQVDRIPEAASTPQHAPAPASGR